MSQITTPTRVAIDAQALAHAIAVWRCDRSDDADIALESALLYQATMAPDEAVQAFEPVRNGSSEILGLFVHLDNGDMFVVDCDGRVHVA